MDLNQEILIETLSRFAVSANHEAKTLFDKLDPNLTPRVTLLAIPFSKEKSGDILVIPAREDISPAWFDEVYKLVSEISESDLNDLAEDVRSLLWQDKVEIWRAVRSIIESESNKFGYAAFTIYPAFLHGYNVSLILQVSKSTLDSHYALTKYSNWGFSGTSLIYETIAAFLYKTVKPLELLSSGVAGYILSEDGDEVLRRAGYWLMDALEKASETEDEVYEDEEQHYTTNIFKICNTISAQPYEGKEGVGRMLISRRDHPNISQAIKLEKPVEMESHRGIRKLLEVTAQGLYLLCDSSGIYGIGRPNELPYDEHLQDLFVVEFIGHNKWKLSHAGRDLMVVKYGQPRLPQKPIDENEFKRNVRLEFPEIKPADLSSLWSLVSEAAQQKHGTMVVVSDHASDEAKRLNAQSTAIEPVVLIPEFILPLSSIDGALLLDAGATCHAIGVILDGVASERGDSSRGARYNSAIKYKDYVKGLGHNCVIIVLSEDGMINVL